ncbi:MAG: SAM-dependent methyltransferase [Thermomicrobiales bacterium]|nr:SAM-dependent methyltransferase [Thermomicrobiales bacterium]
MEHTTAAALVLRDQIERHGPITFATFMSTALYHPEHGYYRQPQRKPGRGGDFMTSPELHPFFGNTLARQVAETWDVLGQPDSLVVREHGASSGGLAYDILVALHEKAPDVLDAIDYRLVDVNMHRLEEAIAAMREVGFVDKVSAEHPDAITPEAGLVLANEVADALPTHRLTMRKGTIREYRVGWDGTGFIDVEAEPDRELREAITAHFDQQGISLPEGARFEFSPIAAEWITQVADNLTAGIAVIIDYGYDAPTLYSGHRLEGTLRGYYQHTATDDPYQRVGQQDLTAHVDFSYLTETAIQRGMRNLGLTTQSEYLTRLGLGDWLMELQLQSDVAVDEYYLAQHATMRLIDPAGLGRFGVLGLGKNLPNDFRPLGFTQRSFAEELAGL